MKRLACMGMVGFMLTGCIRTTTPELSAERENNPSTTYASGFEADGYDGFTLLNVFDPWQNSRDVTFSYVLAEQQEMIPDSLNGLPWIRIPVQRVVTLSTTHIAMIHQLGMAGTIKGVSGTGLVYNPEIRSRIEAGEVVDVGYDQGLSYETIVSLAPDVLFMYGVEGSVHAVSEKLTELEVPVVFCAEYLETHPLGKAEWIRFFSLFYQLEEEADSLFRSIDSSYSSLAEQVSHISDKPRVLTGLPWKDTWYMAGGSSFAARLIEDAGGSFLWRENSSTEAIPLDLESVYARAVEADVWINPGAAVNLDDLHSYDARFRELPVLMNGNVFNNNVRLSPGGGNDYWESGTIRPDWILADLIKVFHPDLLSDHHFIYYRKLK